MDARGGKKKIVLVTNLFPTPYDMERGVFTLQIALRLKELSDMIVVCPMPYFPAWKNLKRFSQWYGFSQVPENYSVQGITVLSPKYFMLPKVSEDFQATLMFLPLLATLSKIKRTRGIDVANAHWLYPDGVATSWACKKIGTPLVLTALGCDVNVYGERRGTRKKIQDAVRNSSAITAVSNDLKGKIESWQCSHSTPVTIPNGVDLNLFALLDKAKSRRALSLPEDLRLILFVGRLSEEKGFDYLIDAARILSYRQGIRDFLVLVVGDGPLGEFYRGRVEAERLSGLFQFQGNQRHDAIPLWMGASDLLCLPSLREGCPNVVMEALSSGRPVVASRVGGVPDIVHDGKEGFLSATANAESLSSCLEKALAFHWDAEKLRASVMHASWDKVAEEYDRVYSWVLRRCDERNISKRTEGYTK
jgi:glycosyltransferase involved in cell wall biosynthesis